MHGGELERLPVQHRRNPNARELPGGDVTEAGVVTLRLTLGRLILLAEVTAARFLAMQGVVAHQLGQLEEVRDAARVLERLVEILARAAARAGSPHDRSSWLRRSRTARRSSSSGCSPPTARPSCSAAPDRCASARRTDSPP